MPAMRPLRPGDPERIGDYRLVGVLGTGGQGAVYRAVAAGSGREVAIKLLHGHLAQDHEMARGFLREVEAARRVAAFCTAAVLDVGMVDERPYIVSEYVPGDTLHAVVRASGPRRGGALDRLAISTLTALAAIHQAGIVHRDFKPGNVLIGPDGPIVIDFGIAKALDATSRTSGVVGTPTYMSPEQFRGERVGTASDVFSWAGTMVYAATGHAPFAGEAVAVIMNAILSGTPDLEGVPGHLRGLLELCFAKDPSARPAPAGLLKTLISQAGPAPSPLPTPTGRSTDPAAGDPAAGPPSSLAGGALPGPSAGSVAASPAGSPTGSAHPGPRPPAAGSAPSAGPAAPALAEPAGGGGALLSPGVSPGASSGPQGGGWQAPPSGDAPSGQAASFGGGAGGQVPFGNGPISPPTPPQNGAGGRIAPGGSTPATPAAYRPAVEQRTAPGRRKTVGRRAFIVGGAAAAVTAGVSAYALFRPGGPLSPGGDRAERGATDRPDAGTSPQQSAGTATTPPSPSPTPVASAEPFGTQIGKAVALPGGSGEATAMAGAGTMAICGADKGAVTAWDLKGSVTRLGDGGGAVSAVAVGGLGGRQVAVSGHRDGRMRLWDLSGDSLDNHRAGDPIVAVTVGERAVAVSQKYDGLRDLHSVVRLWDVSTGKQVGPTINDHFQGIHGVTFGRLNGRDVLVTGDGGQRVRVRRLSDGRLTHSFHTGQIGGVELLACGELKGKPVLVSTHLDATLRVYDLATGKRRKKWAFSDQSPDDRGATALVAGRLGETPIAAVAHAPAGGEVMVLVWNLDNGDTIGVLGSGEGGAIRHLALAELNGHPVITGADDTGSLRAWSLGPP